MMGMNKASRSGRQRVSVQNHKRSIIAICAVIVLLIIMLFVSSITLRAKERSYQVQEIELENQLADEKERSEEIDDLEDYVGTDEYIEEVAKEKLGMIYENELIIKAK